MRDVLLEIAQDVGQEMMDSLYAPVLKRRVLACIRQSVPTTYHPASSELPPLSKLIGKYDYDPFAGVVFRILRNGGRKPLGHLHSDGYIHIDIKLDGKRYRTRAHRLGWALHHGVALGCDELLDHIDGNRSNNAISNLRVASHRANKAYFTERTGVVW